MAWKKGLTFCSQAPLVGIPPSSAYEKTALCLTRAVISVGWQSIFGCFIVYPFVHRRKHVEIIEAHAMPDHIHMLVSIPPKLAVADFMGYLKGKSTLMIFERHANLKYKYGRRVFWAKGYYVNHQLMNLCKGGADEHNQRLCSLQVLLIKTLNRNNSCVYASYQIFVWFYIAFGECADYILKICILQYVKESLENHSKKCSKQKLNTVILT